MPLTVTAFETVNWSSTTTPLTITLTGALTGDFIAVLYGGDNGTGSGNVSAATVTNTAGTTTGWVEPQEALGGTSQPWVSSSRAVVTADGDVTASLSRTQSTGQPWGGWAASIPGGQLGTSAKLGPGSTKTINLTTSNGSAVLLIAIDWDAAPTVALSPAGATTVEASVGANVTSYAAYWTNQAAGTRAYGVPTSATTNISFIVIEILDPNAGAASGPGPYAKPGQNWQRRFKHRQILPAAVTGAPAASGISDATQRSTTETTAAKGAAGAATTAGRAATASTGLKITTGGTVDQQRSTTTTTVRKTSTGAGVDQQRTTSTAAGSKAAAGGAVDMQRTATSSSGTATGAGVSGVAVSVQRSATTSTGRKTAVGAALDQQRSATQETGRKTAAGAGIDQQRSTANVTSLKAAAGSALDMQRSATSSTGGQVVGIGGAARPTQRSSTTSTGRKTTAAAGIASCRATTTGSGTHRAAGAALAATRSHDRATGIRSTSGAARATQRCTVAATGQQFALYTPLTDPAAAVRGNDAAARPRTQPAAATAGNPAATGQRANLAAATAQPNPAEATP